MKRIGIIGGMSYVSTMHYYERINQQVNELEGGMTSADMVVRSVNFEPYCELMEMCDWDIIGAQLGDEALNLVVRDDCDYVALATNTMHMVADMVGGRHEVVDDYGWPPISSLVDVPLVHIGDCIAEKCNEMGAKCVLLLGTQFTMTRAFMRERLQDNGIEVIRMDDHFDDVLEINRIIFEELCHGIMRPTSKEYLIDFVSWFSDNSEKKPDAIILGCTELEMILKPADFDVPLINSTQAHIDKLVELCLEDEDL